MRRRFVALAAVAVLTVPAVASAADITAQTEDWAFVAPDVLGTQADLELNARQAQLCTDEMKRLIAHRPLPGRRFTMRWVIDGGRVSHAETSGVVNHVPDASWRLVDPAARAFRESIVAQGRCFGPHEITHVLTSESLWPLPWANEGFATFSDWLYKENWRCCGTTAPLTGVACDDGGWSDGGPGRRPYSDLSPWDGSYASYATAACLWLEIYRVGGHNAIRRILARLRADAPFTTAELIVHHVNHVLGRDLRPLMHRYGFVDAELTAPGAPPPDPPPTAIAAGRPTLSSTRPRPAGRLTARTLVTRKDWGERLSAATVSCRARVGPRTLPVSSRAFVAGVARCTWTVPRWARGGTVTGTITVRDVGGATAHATFTARVRRVA
jgi:hypothetical protein